MGAYLNVGCDPDLAAACGLVRGSTAIFAHFSSMPGASGDGFSPQEEATVQQVGAVYDEARHGLSHAAHTAVLDDPFVARFAVVGSPERCLARLRQLIALGLDRIVVVPGSRDADPARLARSTERFACGGTARPQGTSRANPSPPSSADGPQYEHPPAQVAAPVGQVRAPRAVEILTHPGRVRVTGVLVQPRGHGPPLRGHVAVPAVLIGQHHLHELKPGILEAVQGAGATR